MGRREEETKREREIEVEGEEEEIYSSTMFQIFY